MTMSTLVGSALQAETARLNTHFKFVMAKVETEDRAVEAIAYMLLCGIEAAMLRMAAGGVSSESAPSSREYAERIMTIYDEALNIVRLSDELVETSPEYTWLGRQLITRANKLLQTFCALDNGRSKRDALLLQKRIPKKVGALLNLKPRVVSDVQVEKAQLLRLT